MLNKYYIHIIFQIDYYKSTYVVKSVNAFKGQLYVAFKGFEDLNVKDSYKE